MGWLWKGRLPPETTNCNNSLAVLWNAVIGRVHFAEVNPVTRFNDGLQKMEDELALHTRQKTLNVLEHERRRLIVCD
jgi:hypothetical protein